MIPRRSRTPLHRQRLDPRLLPAALLACLIGCDGPRKVVHTVSGTLSADGRPVVDAMIAYHPLGMADPDKVLPVARTGPDGSYRLTTYANGDGAPAGEYAVTVVCPDDSQPRDECEDPATHDKFRGRYADPDKSPWRVVVRPGSNEASFRADLPAGGPIPTPSPTSSLPAERPSR